MGEEPPLEAAASRVDRALTELDALADPLLAVTPVNTDEACHRFLAGGASTPPDLEYRPLTVDPAHLRRELRRVRVDEVADESLAALFRTKLRELEAELDLLVSRGSSAFLASSLVVYGAPGPDLVALARRVLATVAALGDRAPEGPTVRAEAFTLRARAEVDRYRELQTGVEIDIEIRDDISGLMVDRGRLLVDRHLEVDESRVDALIQHEVGTHALTWLNGSHQPLGLFRVGLPGYDETQEALAVVAEFAMGGLTVHRMAVLAARVLAADCVVDGASFLDTFRALMDETALSAAAAFDVTVRVHRSGGFTKDVIYLRGLHRLLAHMAAGGSLEDLLFGKYAIEHLPLVAELRAQGVLEPPALLPSWLAWPAGRTAKDAIESGLEVEDLLTVGRS
jgi:uncharacterized protein (TIGR02421 family)